MDDLEIKNGPGIRGPDGKRIALLPTFDFDAEWLRFPGNIADL